MTTKKAHDYSALSIELADILTRLQQPGIQIDQAIVLYEKGIAIVAQLEEHLEKAENKIERLKLASETAGKENI